MLKAAAFQNTMELYSDQRISGSNYCVNIYNAVLLPPKNALFALFQDIKRFFAMTKENVEHRIVLILICTKPRADTNHMHSYDTLV